MTDIALVLFDLNGVLYHYRREVRIDALAALSNQSAETVRRAIWDSGFEDSGDSGVMDADDYLWGFSRCLGGALSDGDWLAALQTAITPMAETLALLPNLRAGVRCGVLTNNNLLVRRHFATLYPEVAALVGEAAYVSAEFGARKPEPEVYRRCLNALQVAPSAVLFVDDSAANVAGAREAGLRGFDFTGWQDLGVELRRLGLLD